MKHYIYVATNPALTSYYKSEGKALKIGYTKNCDQRLLGLNGKLTTNIGKSESKYAQFREGKDVLGKKNWSIHEGNIISSESKDWEKIIIKRAKSIGATPIEGHTTQKGDKKYNAIELFLMPSSCDKIEHSEGDNYSFFRSDREIHKSSEIEFDNIPLIDLFCIEFFKDL